MTLGVLSCRIIGRQSLYSIFSLLWGVILYTNDNFIRFYVGYDPEEQIG